MQFVAIIRRRTEAFTDAEFASVLEPEAARAREVYAQGSFREIHSRGDVPGAVIMLEAADMAEATQLIGTLPFVEGGLADAEIIPLRPYRGFIGG